MVGDVSTSVTEFELFTFQSVETDGNSFLKNSERTKKVCKIMREKSRWCSR